MEHVKSLGLLEKIKANGADQFGDAIRRHLRRQYQINLKEDMEASDEGQSIPRS